MGWEKKNCILLRRWNCFDQFCRNCILYQSFGWRAIRESTRIGCNAILSHTSITANCSKWMGEIKLKMCSKDFLVHCTGPFANQIRHKLWREFPGLAAKRLQILWASILWSGYLVQAAGGANHPPSNGVSKSHLFFHVNRPPANNRLFASIRIISMVGQYLNLPVSAHSWLVPNRTAVQIVPLKRRIS